MKLRNKRLAAGIMAVVFAAAMPLTAFADEDTVSGTDIPEYTAEDLKEGFEAAKDFADKFLDFDTEGVKDVIDSAKDSVKDAVGIPNSDEIKDKIPDEVVSATDKIKDVIGNIDSALPEVDDVPGSDDAADDDDASAEDSKKIFWVDGIWGLNLQVHPGYNVELPDELEVTYTDGTKGMAKVTWTETDDVSPVDATKHNTIFEGTDGEWGFFFIHAHVEGYGKIVAVKVRITAKAPIPEKPEEPTEPEQPTEPEEPTEPEQPTEPEKPADPITPSEVIENVKTGENDLTMVWVLFMFSASAMAVGFTSRKFRRA